METFFNKGLKMCFCLLLYLIIFYFFSLSVEGFNCLPHDYCDLRQQNNLPQWTNLRDEGSLPRCLRNLRVE